MTAQRAFSTMVLRALLALLVSAGILLARPALADDHVPAGDAGARQVFELSEGWRFRFGDLPGGASGQRFDDGDWQQVTVPHTWNLIGEYALTRSEKTNNTQGIGWYRLWYDAPQAAPGMRQYLDFAAVGNIAQVWVNGIYVGQHKGAFSRFRLDVTHAWAPGRKNLVALKADNSKPAVGSSTEQVIPLAGDFFIHGGPYRQVSLLQLPSASIDPLDFGGPGLYARAAEISDDRAVVDVRTRLRNFGKATGLTLELTVHDAEGKVAAKSFEPVTLERGWQDVSARLTIANPRRWNGVSDPYLYSVTASLRAAEGVLDSVTQPLGLRTFRFDADEGFFLNGEYLKLKGVSRHQDRLEKGWALSPEDHAQDMALIAEMGGNSVRHGHYQHADEWSRRGRQGGHGGLGRTAIRGRAEPDRRQGLRGTVGLCRTAAARVDPAELQPPLDHDVVDRQRGRFRPGLRRDRRSRPSPIDLLRRLHEIAKEEDPSRPTVFADFSEDFGPFRQRPASR